MSDSIIEKRCSHSKNGSISPLLKHIIMSAENVKIEHTGTCGICGQDVVTLMLSLTEIDPDKTYY